MARKNEFLDIDPTIIEKNITFMKEWPIKDDLKNVLPFTQPGITVNPSPGFCVKAKYANKDQKLFINICQTDSIPPPDDLTDEELIDILNSDEPVYRIPMSIGEPRTAVDKSGQDCVTYDIAISSKFLKKILTSDLFRNLFLNICFEALQDKYQIEIDTESQVILKNRKCIGNLQAHKIQNRVAACANEDKPYRPLIEDIDTSKDRPKLVSEIIDNKQTNKKLEELEFQLIKEPKEGKIQNLIVKLKIDEKVQIADITIDINDDRILIAIPKNNQGAELYLPCFIKPETAKAVLNKNTNMLVIMIAAYDYNE